MCLKLALFSLKLDKMYYAYFHFKALLLMIKHKDNTRARKASFLPKTDRNERSGGTAILDTVSR